MPRLRRYSFYFLMVVLYYLCKDRVFSPGPQNEQPPVVVIGSGLAGLSAANQLINNGVSVVLLEKEGSFGGNSIKASSGINGAETLTQEQLNVKDSVDMFLQDTIKSSKQKGEQKLMQKLSLDSREAITWLQNEFNIKLDLLSQLGGHTVPRTHRSKGPLPPGFEIVKTLSDQLKTVSENSPEKLKIIFNAKVIDVKVNQSNNAVEEVIYVDSNVRNSKQSITTNHVIFATGGFGYSKEMLKKYAPSLIKLPTTNGKQTTGDGQTLLESIGAGLVDMDQIQIHPTGFINPNDRENNWKFLAAEALRGLGGILVNPLTGKRFVNELKTRDEVTDAIRNKCAKANGIALIVLSEKTYQEYTPNIKFYMSKGLIRKMTVSNFVNHYNIPIEGASFVDDLIKYSKDGDDEFGRSHKVNTFGTDITEDTEIYVGEITPVVHFTMGGVKINEHSQVLTKNNDILATGLYAAGEVTYGVHGSNRLGGSSLLECVVFGRTAANHIINFLKI